MARWYTSKAKLKRLQMKVEDLAVNLAMLTTIQASTTAIEAAYYKSDVQNDINNMINALNNADELSKALSMPVGPVVDPKNLEAKLEQLEAEEDATPVNDLNEPTQTLAQQLTVQDTAADEETGVTGHLRCIPSG